jgi:hypothetical protein
MPEGAIILDRAYFEKPEWLNQSKNGGFSRGMAWLDLLALVNQRATTAQVRGIQMPVERGECAYSKLGLSMRWGRSQNWVSATLAAWEQDGRVQIRKCDNETTVFFLTNFDSWQTGMFTLLKEQNGEQMESRPRASGEQKETDKEKEKEVQKVPRGEGEGVEGGAPSFPEQVGDEVMLAFCRSWAGEPATGAPQMPEDWIVDILARLNGRRDLPRDWKRFVVAMWRKEFRTWHGGQKKTAPESGGLSANVAAIAEQKRTTELQRAIRELEDEVYQDRQSNLPRDAKKMARLKAMRAELQGEKTHD